MEIKEITEKESHPELVFWVKGWYVKDGETIPIDESLSSLEEIEPLLEEEGLEIKKIEIIGPDELVVRTNKESYIGILILIETPSS